jgi:hypothetical protein
VSGIARTALSALDAAHSRTSIWFLRRARESKQVLALLRSLVGYRWDEMTGGERRGQPMMVEIPRGATEDRQDRAGS